MDVQITAPAEVVAARAATAGSEHGAVGGAAGLGSVRHTPKKRVLSPPILPTSGGRALGRRSYCRRSRRVSTVPRTSSS
jgi:hypothetical protein